jgi:hypothetical protein
MTLPDSLVHPDTLQAAQASIRTYRNVRYSRYRLYICGANFHRFETGRLGEILGSDRGFIPKKPVLTDPRKKPVLTDDARMKRHYPTLWCTICNLEIEVLGRISGGVRTPHQVSKRNQAKPFIMLSVEN